MRSWEALECDKLLSTKKKKTKRRYHWGVRVIISVAIEAFLCFKTDDDKGCVTIPTFDGAMKRNWFGGGGGGGGLLKVICFVAHNIWFTQHDFWKSTSV